MSLSKSRSFKFWMTVYSFPAMVPLLLNVAFMYLVESDLQAALGTQGAILGSSISMALMLTFAALMLLAILAARWHAWTGSPELPEHGPVL